MYINRPIIRIYTQLHFDVVDYCLICIIDIANIFILMPRLDRRKYKNEYALLSIPSYISHNSHIIDIHYYINININP